MSILKAIKENDIHNFEKLLVTYVPYSGFNILHETVIRERLHMAELIVKNYPILTVGQDFPTGRTPLMYAIIHGDMDYISLFDGCEETYLTTDFEGNTPLHLAVSRLELEQISHIYNQYPRALYSVNISGETPLHTASLHGVDVEIVKFLYDKDPGNNIPDYYGNYPIHAYGSNAAAVRFLDYHPEHGALSFLANADKSTLLKRNHKGNIPIHELSLLFCVKTSKLFYEICHVIDTCPEALLVRNNIGELPIHISAFHNDVDITCKMIETSPTLIYETTTAGKNILDMFGKTYVADKLELISCILQTKVYLRRSFWNFAPQPLPGVENILISLKPDVRTKMFHYLTRKAKKKIQNMYLAVGTYTRSRNMRLEQEIVDRIVLTSVSKYA
jgi:ankyrin repeat protein